MQPRRLLVTELSLPQPIYGNETQDSYSTDVDFESNMVLILAALLCALVFALVVSSVVRCARRRCSRRLAPDGREQSAEAILATSGLKKRDLERIPVAVFGTGLSFTSTECPICLGEFVDGEKVRVLPKCNHGFHVRCIDRWLVSNSSCPNCRHSLLEHCIENTASSPEDQSGDHQHGGVAVVVQEGSTPRR
ncbi:hypothetical protein V6N12_028777 [Hibiscus sabdariffa]|uniref:RING-type E3 ubiquitin transferase n=1 Tax=Hibiscus sabdariffa TaxID=183260 RepID=A0ABR2F6V8_9ROSI